MSTPSGVSVLSLRNLAAVNLMIWLSLLVGCATKASRIAPKRFVWAGYSCEAPRGWLAFKKDGIPGWTFTIDIPSINLGSEPTIFFTGLTYKRAFTLEEALEALSKAGPSDGFVVLQSEVIRLRPGLEGGRILMEHPATARRTEHLLIPTEHADQFVLIYVNSPMSVWQEARQAREHVLKSFRQD